MVTTDVFNLIYLLIRQQGKFLTLKQAKIDQQIYKVKDICSHHEGALCAAAMPNDLRGIQ